MGNVLRTEFENAEANSGNQGLFVDGEAEGRQVRQDQEEQGQHQVQGAMQPLPLHFGGSRSRKGREAEAVPPSRTRRQGVEVEKFKKEDIEKFKKDNLMQDIAV